MVKKIDSVLKEVLGKISPSIEEIEMINRSLLNFTNALNKRLKKFKINANLFVGGSFSKGTLIKKDSYDVDLFLRFSKKYSEKEIKKLSKKIFRFFRNSKVVHGSRDYYRVLGSRKPSFFFEIVPVTKIKSPDEARNVTDLSFFHVAYIGKKLKSKKILDEVKLAKAFCHGTGTYGAESYVNGFSGYALELLIYHFKTFEKFLRALSKKQSKKLVVDTEKLYKKGNVLLDMNGSKLESPIILVDPTYKERNALAALSDETFYKFQKAAKEFLKKPSIEFFENKKIDFEKIKSDSEKNGFEFLKIELRTNKEKGDVAGTKLLKFFNHLSEEFENNFGVKKKQFEYGNGKLGRGYLVLKNKGEIIFNGPMVKDKKNFDRFVKEHPDNYLEGERVYAKEKIKISSKEFLKKWILNNKKKIKEMSISGIKVY